MRDYLTLHQVAQYLKISYITALRKIRKAKLPMEHFVSTTQVRQKWRITKENLKKYVDSLPLYG